MEDNIIKNKSKKKIVLTLSFLVIVILSTFIIARYNNYLNNINNKEIVNEVIGEDIVKISLEEIQGFLEEPEKQTFPGNPRVKFSHEGAEVAYIDHFGNIMGSSGWFTNINSTNINSTIFYEDGNRLALNLSLDNYLLLTDQRYNETDELNSINTTANIEALNFTQGPHTVDTGTNYYPTDVNLTVGTYNASLVNGSDTGYIAGHAICDAEYSGSHMCNEFEINLWYANGGKGYDNENGWVIAGGGKFIPADVPVNDCLGFTYDGTVSYLGSYYHFDNDNGGDIRNLNCASEFKLPCCTYE